MRSNCTYHLPSWQFSCHLMAALWPWHCKRHLWQYNWNDKYVHAFNQSVIYAMSSCMHARIPCMVIYIKIYTWMNVAILLHISAAHDLILKCSLAGFTRRGPPGSSRIVAYNSVLRRSILHCSGGRGTAAKWQSSLFVKVEIIYDCWFHGKEQ